MCSSFFFRFLFLDYILTWEPSVEMVIKPLCFYSKAKLRLNLVKSPPEWNFGLVSLQPPKLWHYTFMLSSEFLWGEQDANTIIRTWERERDTFKAEAKTQCPQDIASIDSMSVICWGNCLLVRASLLFDLWTTQHHTWSLVTRLTAKTGFSFISGFHGTL